MSWGTNDAVLKSTEADGEDIQLLVWMNESCSTLYTLAARANDLDGFDIQALGDMLYDFGTEEGAPVSED